MSNVALGFLGLFLAGLLAGEELAVCAGVRAAIASLDDSAHIRCRQALIRRLRVLVPAILLPTIAILIGIVIFEGHGVGLGFRSAALGSMVAFVLVTFLGTVPINQAALDWNPDAPPSNWKVLVDRWERLDVVRCVAAVVAFACLSGAVAQSLFK